MIKVLPKCLKINSKWHNMWMYMIYIINLKYQHSQGINVFRVFWLSSHTRLIFSVFGLYMVFDIAKNLSSMYIF